MQLKDFLENFILIAIVLVIIQTFFNELSVYLHWSVYYRQIIMVSGFFFDLIFTIEFTVRSIASGNKKNLFRYWFYERGWVDFISSIPLLMLDSGPSLYLLLSGGMHEAETTIGVLNILKVVKAIRVTRILRLVRIIKIFGKIHNTESKMAQHHTTTISTTAVFTIVCTLIGFSLFFADSTGVTDINSRKANYIHLLAEYDKIEKTGNSSNKKLINRLIKDDKNILRLYSGKKLVISNVKDDLFKSYYNVDDYITIKNNRYTIYSSIVDIHKKSALNHMQSFFIIVLVVLSFMIIYTKHFAQNLSDMIHILNKGFRKKDYNLQVKIREEFNDQEIFRLARFYNDAYLPAKLKRIQEQEKNKSSALSMDDLLDFKKK